MLKSDEVSDHYAGAGSVCKRWTTRPCMCQRTYPKYSQSIRLHLDLLTTHCLTMEGLASSTLRSSLRFLIYKQSLDGGSNF